jgi:hypothetical protein
MVEQCPFKALVSSSSLDGPTKPHIKTMPNDKALELLKKLYAEIRSFGSQMPFSLDEAMGEEGAQVLEDVAVYLEERRKEQS